MAEERKDGFWEKAGSLALKYDPITRLLAAVGGKEAQSLAEQSREALAKEGFKKAEILDLQAQRKAMKHIGETLTSGLKSLPGKLRVFFMGKPITTSKEVAASDRTDTHDGSVFVRLRKGYASADVLRDKVAKQLGLGGWASATETTFGPDAARLETQSREAAQQGRILDAASLGVRSMGEGLLDMMQKGAMKRVTGGEHVNDPVGIPSTPKQSPGSSKDSQKR